MDDVKCKMEDVRWNCGDILTTETTEFTHRNGVFPYALCGRKHKLSTLHSVNKAFRKSSSAAQGFL